MELIA